jgi:hypothetical protein
LPLSQLDSNFATGITIGNTSVVLGDTISTINNLVLANVAITSVSTAFPNGYLANSNVIVGTTTLTLGSTVTAINGLSLSNVTISSGNVTISNVTTTNVTATTANVTTANIGTLVVIGDASVGGNVTITGNVSAAKGTFTSANVSGTANVQVIAVTQNATVAGNATVTGNVSMNVATITTANVSGTANISTLVITTNQTSLGNITATGNVTAAKLIPTGTSVTGNGLYLPAANALGLSTNGTNAVYIDASQNVGIGTTSPAYKLDVQGSIGAGNNITTGTGVSTGAASIELGGARTGDGISFIDFHSVASTDYESRLLRNGGANGTFAITNNGTGNFELVQANAGSIAFQTQASERMRIDSSGNVGIGTSSPSSMSGTGLQVGASSIFENVASSQTLVGGNAYYTGSAWKAVRTQTGYAAMRQNAIGPGVTSFHQNVASYTAGDTLTAMDTTDVRMVIDASGNVGIGTSSPSQKLNVSGGSIMTDSGGSTSSPSLMISSGALGTAGLYAPAANTLGIVVSATERMRIDSSGNLAVGATSGFGGNRLYASGVASATNSSGVLGVQSSTAGDTAYPVAFFCKFDSNSTTSQVYLRFAMNNNGTSSGQINANGTNAAAFGSWSDRRLKENITELPSQLANIMALRPVEFDYIESEGGGHQIGFIAQEVQAIYPDLVGERDDGMLTLSDMNKNDARLIKAIQEQQTLITSLTARITALENK